MFEGSVTLRRSAPFIVGAFLISGCSAGTKPVPLSALPASTETSASTSAAVSVKSDSAGASPTTTLFATYSNARVASIDVYTPSSTSPLRTIKGERTLLAPGDGGVAIGPGGAIYALSPVGPRQMQLLVFAPQANGNVPPVRTALLPASDFSGFTNHGILLDGYGNFWTLNALGNLERYALNGSGSMKPDRYVIPELDTPSGFLHAKANAIAADRWGHLYCLESVVYHGGWVHGVTEYQLSSGGQPQILRSFYTFELPEQPAQYLAIDDANATIDIGFNSPQVGVFLFPRWSSGDTITHQFLVPLTTAPSIAGIAVDRAGTLYLAMGSRINIFASGSQGYVAPSRTIYDPVLLQHGNYDYGSLIAVQP